MDHLEIHRQVRCDSTRQSQRSNLSKNHPQGNMVAANYTAVMRVLRAVLSLSEAFKICLKLANDEESQKSW